MEAEAGVVHTTELGVERIKRNLCLDAGDVVEWCVITVNAYSYTIITAHRKKG